MKLKSNVSIIIPTYNRPKEVMEVLQSIYKQETTPKEVIIVDDSIDDRVKKVVDKFKGPFQNIGVYLKYVKNTREKSLTLARNIGLRHAKGDIVIFLDDDVILDRKYIKELLKIYGKYPFIKGVQGYFWWNTKHTLRSKLGNAISKLFFIFYYSKDLCSVLPSFKPTYPYPLTRTMNCSWLSGCNASYLRHVISRFKFDENLKIYALGEDLDASYRIHKQYPGSLLITPNCILLHKRSLESRLPDKKLIYLSTIYSYYLFFKNMPERNLPIFVWSRIGYVALRFLDCVKSIFNLETFRLSVKNLTYQIKIEFICAKNIKYIKKGDLRRLNHLLLKNDF